VSGVSIRGLAAVQDIWNSIILGIVEGLTEFLPVSSTAHLLVAEKALMLDDNRWHAFTVVIQLGAILSVVAVYWSKFWQVLVGLPREREAQMFTAGVLVAFFPAVIAGLAFGKIINTVLLNPTLALPVIATTWIVGGILMLVLERIAPRPRYLDGDRLPLMKCFQVGLCQLAALLPGVSRSGATILGGELLGIERKAISHFTFYLAVPTMFGASAYELYKEWRTLTSADTMLIAIGFVVSFFVAWIVVRGFIDFVGRYGLVPFAWYRIAAGAVLIGFLTLR
jgi:undecaprenyl-diphosphatase